MELEELHRLVEEISLRQFGKPFRYNARFNARLRSTGGRYLLKSHDLEFNPKQLETHGMEEFIRIIRHELCHYHLHLEGRGYRHSDPDFKALLKRVGGTRFCKSLPDARRVHAVKYLLKCKACKMEYPRKRRMDPKRYRCGRCQGKLEMIEMK